jgi:hypothetical protein
MGKNTGNDTRIGAILNRTQVFNPVTNMYVKRDVNTGKFMGSKENKYKGVRVEKKSK